MEHNLGDTLNLENAMNTMDFDHSGVVHETDITLKAEGRDESIPMKFESIEEEQMMMDTENEEIIVSDFIGDQFTLQEYCYQKQDETHEGETVIQTDQMNVLSSQAETMLEFQYESEGGKFIPQESHQQPKIFAFKTATTPVKNIAPKQVMIAPKPPNFSSSGPSVQKSVVTKQYAIAPKPGPKPVQFVKSSIMKVSLGNITQGGGKPVFAQVGGKLLMLPASGGSQKIKLVPATSGGTMHYVKAIDQQSQLITPKLIQGNKQAKPVLSKVTLQGQSSADGSNQPAVLTKLIQVANTTSTGQPRYVMHQKTVPISMAGSKVILSSPTKQSNLKIAKKQQLVTVKSPTPKLLPAPAQPAASKKVIISANPSQNVILKTTATSKTAGSNEGSLLLNQGQRTQLHQIDVPGKGVQYIRLVRNNPPAKAKPAAQPNTFMVTDAKGNLIPVTAEKMGNNQPPLLVITGNVASSNKGTSKCPKKLVRLAPVGGKMSQIIQPSRSSQSLLAPISPTQEIVQSEELSLEDSNIAEVTIDIQDVQRVNDTLKQDQGENLKENNVSRSLLAHNMGTHKFGEEHSMTEVIVDFETHESLTEDVNTSEDSSQEQNKHPLIVIPSDYEKQQQDGSPKKTLVFFENDSDPLNILDKTTSEGGNIMNVEAEIVPYSSPSPPPMISDIESEMARSNELGRPRKACNCTKSQCLKLYCDCFANGEFCNNCNCNNCHNNLENEELRQKAIRACLDRNPNAFRPKIGKAKVGGPEPVRRHTKGCNCKRSGCLKNYCECFEAKIECTATCKCVGCRNVEEVTGKRRGAGRGDVGGLLDPMYRPPHNNNYRLPCSFMTTEVIEAVCQCLIAAAVETDDSHKEPSEVDPPDPLKDVIEEFARCLQDIINASHQAGPALPDEVSM